MLEELDLPRWSMALILGFLGVAIALVLVVTRGGGLAAALTPPHLVRANVVQDQQLLQMETTQGPGRPVISEAQAVSLAQSFVATSGTATTIQSSYVNLTFRDTDGAVIR